MLDDQLIFLLLVLILLIDHRAVYFFVVLLLDGGQGSRVRRKDGDVLIGQLLGIALRIGQVDQRLIHPRFLRDFPQLLKSRGLLVF